VRVCELEVVVAVTVMDLPVPVCPTLSGCSCAVVNNDYKFNVQCTVSTNLANLPSYNVSGWIIAQSPLPYTMPQFTVTGIPGTSSASHVGSNAMNRLPIIVLSLIQLSIVSVDDNAFADIGNTLTTLNMSQNAITTISPGVFNGLSNLQVLDLSNNRIQTLNIGQFQQLTALTDLYLGANMLTLSACPR
jgi:hypothetical protein